MHGLTIRGIAREAGVNSAAISYYFSSKDRLIEEALKTTLANAFGDWEVLLESREGNFEARMRTVLAEVLEGALKFPGIVKAHLYDTFINGSTHTLFIKRFGGFLSLLARELRAQRPHTDARDAGAEAAQLVSAVLLPGIMPQLFRGVSGFDVTDPRARSQYVDSLMRRFF